MANHIVNEEIDSNKNKDRMDNFESEMISKFIINKLINYSIYEIETKKFETMIPKHCFEDSKKIIDNVVKEEYIAFDKDEFIISKTSPFITETKIFYDNIFFGTNDWSFINEPKPDKIDRNAASTISMLKNEEQVTINPTPSKSPNENHLQVRKQKILGTVKMSTMNLMRLDPAKEKEEKLRELKEARIKRGSNYIEDFSERIIALDEKENPLFNETDSIKELRKKLEEDLKKNEEVVTQKKKIEIDLQEKFNEQLRKQKEFDRKNVTADYQGNVIMVKPIILEKLSSDFMIPKSSFRDPPENRIDSPSKTKREDGRLPSGLNLNQRSESDRLKSNIIRKKTVIPVGDKQPQFKEFKVVQPAGSNFDFINAETGVCITEGSKSKNGGKDFSSHFGKASKYDYSNLNKDKSTNVGSQLSQNFMMSSNNENSRYESNSYNSNKNQLILPKIFNNSLNNDSTGKSSYNNKISLIKINPKISGNLKFVLDSLESADIYNEDEYNINNSIDIFKRKKVFQSEQKEMQMKMVSESLEEINKFNLNILKSGNWGSPQALKIKSDKSRFHFKPDLKELGKELGIHVVSKKLPRSRVKLLKYS